MQLNNIKWPDFEGLLRYLVNDFLKKKKENEENRKKYNLKVTELFGEGVNHVYYKFSRDIDVPIFNSVLEKLTKNVELKKHYTKTTLGEIIVRKLAKMCYRECLHSIF